MAAKPFRASLLQAIAHFRVDGFVVCLGHLLGDGDALLHKIVVRALKADGQLDVLVLHHKQLSKLFLVPGVPLGGQFVCQHILPVSRVQRYEIVHNS